MGWKEVKSLQISYTFNLSKQTHKVNDTIRAISGLQYSQKPQCKSSFYLLQAALLNNLNFCIPPLNSSPLPNFHTFNIFTLTNKRLNGTIKVESLLHQLYSRRFCTKSKNSLPYVERPHIEEQLKSTISEYGSDCNFIWVLGPKGAGKSTCVQHAIASLAENPTKPTLTSIWLDCHPLRQFNLQIFMWNLHTSIRAQLIKITQSLPLNGQWVYECLSSYYSDFQFRLITYIEILIKSNSIYSPNFNPAANKKLQTLHSQFLKHKNGEDCWNELIKIMQYECPNILNLIQSNNTFPLAIYLAANIPQADCLFTHNTIESITKSAHISLEYILCLVDNIYKQFKINITFVWNNPNVFMRSPYLQNIGFELLSRFLISAYHMFKINHILITSDPLFQIYLSFFLRASPNHISEKFIEIGEFEKQIVFEVLGSMFTKDDQFFEAIWRVVGGNISLIEKITRSFQELYFIPISQHSTSLSSIVPHQELKQKQAIQNILYSTLRSEVIQFESKMNHLLCLKLITDLQYNFSSSLGFYCLVFETTRSILLKAYILCKDFHLIKHPITLALLETEIITTLFDPNRLSVSNRLYKLLISTYISNFYESLDAPQKRIYDSFSIKNLHAIKHSFKKI